MTGHARDYGSSSDVQEATEFVRGAQAQHRQAAKDTAGAVVAGILSAALFAHRKKSR